MTRLYSKLRAVLYVVGCCTALLCAASASAQTLYYVSWTDLQNLTYNQSTHALTKTGTSGWNAGALSMNVLEASTDGHVEYTCLLQDELSGYLKMLGLAEHNTDAGYSAIDYCMFLNSGRVYIYEKGSYQGYFGKIYQNDVLSVERSGSTIYYKKNGTTLRSVSTTATKVLYADVSLTNVGTSIVNVQCSFSAPYSAEVSTENSDCGTGGSGSATLSVVGGREPYTYEWSTSATTSNISGLDPGTYTVTITDYDAVTLVTQGQVFSDAEYYNDADVFIGGTIIRKQSADGWSSGYASTKNNLGPSQSGSLTYEYESYDGPKILAFRNQALESPVSISDLDYALWFAQSNVIFMTKGKPLAYFSKAVVDDFFELARDGSSIKVYENGRELFSTAANASIYLVGEVLMHDQWAQFDGISASFCGGTLAMHSLDSVSYPDTNGVLTLVPLGGWAPYSYAWAGGMVDSLFIDSLLTDTALYGDTTAQTIAFASQSSVEGLATGWYPVEISDAFGATATGTIRQGASVLWMDVNGITISDDNTLDANKTTWGSAVASIGNLETLDQGGAIRLEVGSVAGNAVVGLTSNTAAQMTEYDDASFALYLRNDTLYYWNGTTLATASTGLELGDELELLLDSGAISAKLNGTQVATGSVSPGELHRIDVSMLASNLRKITIIGRQWWPHLAPVITHPSCSAPTGGSIDLNVSWPLANPNFTFFWSKDGEAFEQATEEITNLAPGVYSLHMTFTDPAGNLGSLNRTFQVGFGISWTGLDGTTATGNSLARTSAGSGPAGAYSENRLYTLDDGWTAFEIPDYSSISPPSGPYYVNFGFTRTALAGSTTYMDYALILYEGTNGVQFQVVNDLVNQQSYVHYLPFAPGHKVWIQRTGNQLHFYLGSLQNPFQSITINPNQELRVDAGILSDVYEISNASASFGCSPHRSIQPYAHLKKRLDGGFSPTTNGVLYFMYEELYSPPSGATLSYTVYGPDRQPLSTQPSLSTSTVELGRNAYSMDMDAVGGLQAGFYLLEVTTLKNEKQYLRFKYE